ncbi:MAG: type I restriction-modification system subunit M N-terminal domain-containing protein [Halobacteriales archaeon]|nr:type I restriction-modification system subunit M N-terminal domain-containing protein [Halobacteriales archaeon]
MPERARWDHIKAQETDIGAALNKALAAVEDENDPIADRVLTTVDFNDKERLADSLLSDLVSHFSKHRYRNEDLEDPGHLRAGVRVPHPAVRRRRGQEGRRVLHAARGCRAYRRVR